MKTNPVRERIVLFLFLIICYFPIFNRLGTPPIKSWDESLYAMRAFHFYETGTYLPSFAAFPGMEHQNLKPPLMTLTQALFFPIFEHSDLEMFLRFPIALCVVGIVLLMLWYSKQITGHYWLGMIWSTILMTSEGFIRVHVGRTGDHDAALSFFLFLSCFAFLKYIHEEDAKKKVRRLILLSALLYLTFLTKSVVAFFFIPGFILYAATQKQLGSILRTRSTYIAGASLLAGIVAYYGLMEYLNPGFMDGVRGHALGRYTEAMGFQTHEDYYFKRLYESSYKYWIYFIPLGLSLIFSNRLKQGKNLGQLAVYCTAPFLLIITGSQTRYPWYDAPIYPLLAIIVGLGIYQFILFLQDWMKRSSYFPASSLLIYLVLGVFLLPYLRIVKQFEQLAHQDDYDQYGYIMEAVDKRHDIKTYKAYMTGYSPQLSFYIGYYNRRKAYDISLHREEEDFQVGDYVMFCQGPKRRFIEEKFEFELVEGYGKHCRMLKLVGIR